ncbi:MAG: hypothetical protein PHS34_09205, partial [Candidatus Omnitrophica bacterium]|nr:hypothetical protein [Candidatus Omnitrophota bacterium]
MRFLRHILTKKKIIIPVLLGLVLVISFCAFNQVKAQDSIVSKVEQGAFTWFISTPILFFVSLLARLLTNLIRLLVWIAQYNDFINSPAVSKGWIIIRDICNMSFILVLLVIAFCTVLKIENYSYKKLLGKLVMAAVLVNFSKFICGFLIDISQIIMLTFVNAFKAAAEGNFAQMLGLEKIMYFRKDLGGTGISGGETFIALILGLIMTAVAVIVVGIITIILAMRIVTIWFLVLLSPLVFVANILPGQQSYSKKWWDSFNHNLIVGPAMAFMLWLSLAVVQDQGNTIYKTMVSSETAQNIETIEASTTGDKLVVAITETGQPQYILNFIIGIAMLVGSLMVAQQLGVAGSQIAGKGIKGMQNFASGAVKGITKPITEPIRGLGIGAGKLVRDIEAATHIPLTKERRLAIGAEKKRKEVEGREGIWGRRIERGMLRGMPTGVEEWADTMSLKGFPKTAIRGTKAVFKRDLAWREKAFESNNNAEFLKTARDSSISESGYKK